MPKHYKASCNMQENKKESDLAKKVEDTVAKEVTKIQKRKNEKEEEDAAESTPKKEQKTLTIVFSTTVVTAPIETTSTKNEEMGLAPEPEKEEITFDTEKVEAFIDKIKKFLCSEKARWEETAATKEEEEDEDEDEEDTDETIKKNLARGAKVLMKPLSMPYYLDQYNQGRFYVPDKDDERGYIRSAKHAIRSEDNLKDPNLVAKVTGVNLEKGRQANIGLFPNIFVNLPAIEGAAKQPEKKLPAGQRYDKAIAYKIALATYAAKQVAGLPFLTAKCENNYHPLMVIVDVHDFLRTYFQKYDLKYIWAKKKEPDLKTLESCTKPFTKFLMYFFVGVVNKIARLQDLRVDMTMRTSFGYDTPSIADTPIGDKSIGSFRINMGLMAPAYADVVCQALRFLAGMLKAVIDNNKGMRIAGFKLDNIMEYYSDDIENGPLRIQNFNRVTDYLQLACFKIEKKGKPAINNITRKNIAGDYINASAFNRFDPSTPGSLATAFINTLQQLLHTMKIKDDTLSAVIPKTAYLPLTTKPEKTDIMGVRKDLLKDLQGILDVTSNQIELLFNLVTEPAPELKLLKGDLQLLLQKNNPHLSTLLDISNEFIYYLILKQLENSPENVPQISDGYGSESDCEEGGIAGKKITTHNGMRSILSSAESVRQILRNGEDAPAKVNLDVNATYYEVKMAIAELNRHFTTTDDPPKKTARKKKKKKKAKVKAKTKGEKEEEEVEEAPPPPPPPTHAVLRDNNAIVNRTTNPLSQSISDELKNSVTKYWVIDITGSTQEKTEELIELLKTDPEKILFLVSSGFKNEQGGGEKNPYGTVRVFTNSTNKAELGEALQHIKDSDTQMPGLSHHIRRMHKLIGNVPTNRSIIHKGEDIAATQEEALSLANVTDSNNTTMPEAPAIEETATPMAETDKPKNELMDVH